MKMTMQVDSYTGDRISRFNCNFYYGIRKPKCGLRIACVYYLLCLLCLCALLFICAVRSPSGKGLPSWLSFVVSNYELVTFLLVSLVRSGA